MIGKIGRLKPDENAPPIVLIDKLGLDFLKPDFITNISERKWNALRCLYIPFCLIYFCCVLYLTIIIANIKPEVNHHPFLVDKLYGWWTGLALCLLEFAVLLYKFLCEYYRDVDSLKNIQEIPQNIREKCGDPQNMQKKCVITMESPTSPRDFTIREQNSTKKKKRNLRYIIYDFTYNCRLNVIVLFLSYLAMYQIPQWQWIFVLLTIFSWWSLLNLITKIPSLGVYILVVRQVVNSFLLFLPVVIIFVLPFAALFHWLLAEKVSKFTKLQKV
uniref:Uncharacterized protein n=1 Tax=Panagrolaimus sp. PS1159 TaxID=55785 RepID=A0AC35F1D0_9BILA